MATMATELLQNFIGGQYVPVNGQGRMPLIDPVTEETYGELPVSDASDVDAAYAAAVSYTHLTLPTIYSV